MTKPKVNIDPVANVYAGPNERIVEFWSSELQLGCLVSIQSVNGKLLIEPYAGDEGVLLRFHPHGDTQIPR